MASLWKCLACRVAYEVGLRECPECRSVEHEEVVVPKATVGGASNAGELPDVVAVEVAGDVTVADVVPDSAEKPKRVRAPKAKAAAKPADAPAAGAPASDGDTSAASGAPEAEPQLPADPEC